MVSRLSLLLISYLLTQQISAQSVPVRNDVPRIGQQEIIMMRHAYLEEGGYDYWYEQSSTKVWPWFERLGARIIGDFEIIYPEGEDATPRQDEALRFARYASYEHWQATRPATAASSGDTRGSQGLAGNGPLFDANNDGLSSRGQVSQGSRGGYFLQGYMAEDRPIYMPGLQENYSVSNSAASSNDAIPARLAMAEPREEIFTLDYRRVKKGSFEEFHAIVSERIWPYAEKIGARPVGQWKVMYLPNSSAEENEEYDEVYSLMRYASFDHYLAAQENPISMGGNGPDFQQLLDAVEIVNTITFSQSTEFLAGPLWGSKPHYAPSTGENFQRNN